MVIYIFDTLFEGLALNNEQGNELRRVGLARRHFSEVHVLVEQVLGKFLYIQNLGHRTDGESAKMRVHDEWLGISIADDSNTRCAAFELVE